MRQRYFPSERKFHRMKENPVHGFHRHYRLHATREADGSFSFPYLERPLTPDEIAVLEQSNELEACAITTLDDEITQIVVTHPQLTSLITWAVGRVSKSQPELIGSVRTLEKAALWTQLAHGFILYARDILHSDDAVDPVQFRELALEYQAEKAAKGGAFGVELTAPVHPLPLN